MGVLGEKPWVDFCPLTWPHSSEGWSHQAHLEEIISEKEVNAGAGQQGYYDSRALWLSGWVSGILGNHKHPLPSLRWLQCACPLRWGGADLSPPPARPAPSSPLEMPVAGATEQVARTLATSNFRARGTLGPLPLSPLTHRPSSRAGACPARSFPINSHSDHESFRRNHKKGPITWSPTFPSHCEPTQPPHSVLPATSPDRPSLEWSQSPRVLSPFPQEQWGPLGFHSEQ